MKIAICDDERIFTDIFREKLCITLWVHAEAGAEMSACGKAAEYYPAVAGKLVGIFSYIWHSRRKF